MFIGDVNRTCRLGDGGGVGRDRESGVGVERGGSDSDGGDRDCSEWGADRGDGIRGRLTRIEGNDVVVVVDGVVDVVADDGAVDVVDGSCVNAGLRMRADDNCGEGLSGPGKRGDVEVEGIGGIIGDNGCYCCRCRWARTS